MAARRRLRLADQAERDFLEILRWTTARFGSSQSVRYRGVIAAALGELQEDPLPPNVQDRSDILPSLKFYHVAHRRRPGRHFILFKIVEQDRETIVEVLRILHDSMDFKQHLAGEGGSEDPAG